MTFFEVYSFYMSIAGIVGHFMFISQAIVIIKNKSSKNVSLSGNLIALLSLLSWLFYGYLIASWPLIAANAFGSLANLFAVSTIIYYKK